MPWFDFVITDNKAFPPELEPYFAEKPLRLSSSFIPLTPETDAPLTVTREQYGLPVDAFVMAAFGNSYKFTPELFSVWLSLLNDIPQAVLWLVDDNPATTANPKAFIYRSGAPVDRIVFTPRGHYEEYRQRLKLADVFLDTFPYNCGSTTNNVVQAGLPMVTMFGKTMVSRMGLSILSSLDLEYFCVDNPKDYVERVRFISNISVEQTAALRLKIRSACNQNNLSSQLELLIESITSKREGAGS
jgi:predicted O-linked N-acetylglucosamine transferase (SPINDLY family)